MATVRFASGGNSAANFFEAWTTTAEKRAPMSSSARPSKMSSGSCAVNCARRAAAVARTPKS